MEELELPEAELEIEAPPGLLPDLTQWGIEEYERGVCMDTTDNRRTLRQNKARWNPVYDSNGRPTGFIQAVTTEMYQAAQALSKGNLLTDVEDANSDYLNGVALIMAPDANQLAPTWVLKITRTYIQQEMERRELGDDARLHQSRLQAPPTRCLMRKADGTRCWGWCVGTTDMNGMCRIHAKKAKGLDPFGPNAQQIARNRAYSASPGMLEVLEEIAYTSVSDAARVAAANSILDRAGVRGGIEIDNKLEIHVVPAAETVKERLAALAKGHADVEILKAKLEARENGEDEDIIDAEEVTDDE